jgi:hypothetical protein
MKKWHLNQVIAWMPPQPVAPIVSTLKLPFRPTWSAQKHRMRPLMIVCVCSVILAAGRQKKMGAFLLGLIVGVGLTLAFVIYDEGEYFLRLHKGVRRTIDRYKQQVS